MKRLIHTLMLLLGALVSHAQESLPVKDFGGFILDMGTMLNAESLVVSTPPMLNLSLLTPAYGQEATLLQMNPDAFKLDTDLTYMGGTSPTSAHTSYLSLLYPGIGSGMKNWQGASYKLKNGMRINLYGEYNADGYKVHNPSAMPWQRKDFNAAFEMKSANGNFGIKVEVHGGRGY